MSDQATTGASTERTVHSPGLPRYRDGRVVVAGIAIWGVLLVAGILRHDQLVDEGRGWWIWAAVAGVVLGLMGLGYIRARAVLSDRRDGDRD